MGQRSAAWRWLTCCIASMPSPKRRAVNATSPWSSTPTELAQAPRSQFCLAMAPHYSLGVGQGEFVWVCKSPLRPRHPRKNWFVDAFELPSLPPPPAVALADVRFELFRAGGPGGQHQNKTESAVRATHVPTGVSATAREERSQHRNKALALGRLNVLLDLRARLREAGEERLIHGMHRDVRRGAATLRFRGS